MTVVSRARDEFHEATPKFISPSDPRPSATSAPLTGPHLPKYERRARTLSDTISANHPATRAGLAWFSISTVTLERRLLARAPAAPLARESYPNARARRRLEPSEHGQAIVVLSMAV